MTTKPRQTTIIWRTPHLTRPNPNMRSTRHSLAKLLLVLVTLTLASSVEAAAKGSKGKVKVRPVKSKILLEGISVKVFKSRDVQRDFCRSFTDSIGLDEKVCAREAPEQPLNSSLNVSHAVVSRPARLLADLPLCFSRGGSFLGTVQTKYFQFCKIKKVERACRTCFTSCNVRFVIDIPQKSDKCDRCDKLAVVVRNDARNVLVQQNTVFNSITNINVNVNVIQNNIEIVAPREPWQAPVLTIDAAAYARDSKRKVKVRPVKSKVRLEGISVKVFESRDVQRDFCR
ncbi:MAG: hypothetical protein ACKVKX_11105, partial [Pseudomonadales bacterium]